MNLQQLDEELSRLERNSSMYNDRMEYIKNQVSTNKLKKYVSVMRTPIGKTTLDGKITYRNWWGGNPELIWFTRFLRHRFPDADYYFNFFSVVGDHDNLTEEMPGKKIFYSGECLNKNPLVTHINETFGSYAMDYVDFAMGFDLLSNPKYLRIPYWATYHFSPVMTEEEIENTITEWNSLDFEKKKNVVVVASHDSWKSRTIICDDVEKVTHIDYGGRWRNNTDELKTKFGDIKVDYLKQFKFNVCAENVNDDGYVTEKIFDSIRADCIPLYSGGGDYLEPEVVNRNKVLLWDFEKDNSDTIELLKTLVEDEKSFREFKDQDYLHPKSYKFINKMYLDLEKQFERLIYD